MRHIRHGQGPVLGLTKQEGNCLCGYAGKDMKPAVVVVEKSGFSGMSESFISPIFRSSSGCAPVKANLLMIKSLSVNGPVALSEWPGFRVI